MQISPSANPQEVVVVVVVGVVEVVGVEEEGVAGVVGSVVLNWFSLPVFFKKRRGDVSWGVGSARKGKDIQAWLSFPG